MELKLIFFLLVLCTVHGKPGFDNRVVSKTKKNCFWDSIRSPGIMQNYCKEVCESDNSNYQTACKEYCEEKCVDDLGFKHFGFGNDPDLIVDNFGLAPKPKQPEPKQPEQPEGSGADEPVVTLNKLPVADKEQKLLEDILALGILEELLENTLPTQKEENMEEQFRTILNKLPVTDKKQELLENIEDSLGVLTELLKKYTVEEQPKNVTVTFKQEGELCGRCFSPATNFSCGTCAPGLNCVDLSDRAIMLDGAATCKKKVNCQLSPWSNYSSCYSPQSCGRGSKSRNRQIVVPAANGGTQCSTTTNTVRCYLRPCPVDCEWSDWQDEGECSNGCGRGNIFQRRTKTTEEEHGGKCPGNSTRYVDCYSTKRCPIHGGWGDWSDWDNCPVTCGGGDQSRTRVCHNPIPQHGGDGCTVDGSTNKETQRCNEEECPDLCKNTFANNLAAGCIIYDDKKCDGHEGRKELSNGETLAKVTETLDFDIESVSVKKGCILSVFTGENFSGVHHHYKADSEDLHVTFKEENLEALQDFDDNVNSAQCHCITTTLTVIPTRFQPRLLPQFVQRLQPGIQSQYLTRTNWLNNPYAFGK